MRVKSARLPIQVLWLRASYPTLGSYIMKCYENDEMEKLYDFLFHIEMEAEVEV
jgi:hypothetical protein